MRSDVVLGSLLLQPTLRGCGNISAAARAVGFSASLIWQRRRKWPDFQQRMETALKEAEIVLEFRLVTLGNDKRGLGDAEDRGATPEAAILEA